MSRHRPSLRGIIRAYDSHPSGAAVAALRRSFAPAVLKSNPGVLTKASLPLIIKKAPGGAFLIIGGGSSLLRNRLRIFPCYREKYREKRALP